MAITTIYRGIEYRSRLEARWAAFFTNIGWEHTYEPFDGNGYIPDFLVHGESPFLVEIKPAVTRNDYEAATSKVEVGLAGIWDRRVLILGASPLPSIPNDYEKYENAVSFGLLSDAACYSDEGEGGRYLGRGWHMALVSLNYCGEVGFCDEYMSYHHSPCGCYDGNNSGFPDARPAIRTAWAAACNDVKWRGKAA